MTPTELFANNFVTQLAAPMLASDMTMTVAAAAPAALQAAGQFRVQIQGDGVNPPEFVIVSGPSAASSVWTILTRGDGGSSAVAHTPGRTVTQILTAEGLESALVNAEQVAEAAGTAAVVSEASRAGTAEAANAAGVAANATAIASESARALSAEAAMHVAVGTPVASATPSALLTTDGAGQVASGPVTSSVVIASGVPSDQATIATGSGTSFWSPRSVFNLLDVNLSGFDGSSPSINATGFQAAINHVLATGQELWVPPPPNAAAWNFGTSTVYLNGGNGLPSTRGKGLRVKFLPGSWITGSATPLLAFGSASPWQGVSSTSPITTAQTISGAPNGWANGLTWYPMDNQGNNSSIVYPKNTSTVTLRNAGDAAALAAALAAGADGYCWIRCMQTVSGQTQEPVAECNRVLSVSGQTVTFEHPLMKDYQDIIDQFGKYWLFAVALDTLNLMMVNVKMDGLQAIGPPAGIISSMGGTVYKGVFENMDLVATGGGGFNMRGHNLIIRNVRMTVSNAWAVGRYLPIWGIVDVGSSDVLFEHFRVNATCNTFFECNEAPSTIRLRDCIVTMPTTDPNVGSPYFGGSSAAFAASGVPMWDIDVEVEVTNGASSPEPVWFINNSACYTKAQAPIKNLRLAGKAHGSFTVNFLNCIWTAKGKVVVELDVSDAVTSAGAPTVRMDATSDPVVVTDLANFVASTALSLPAGSRYSAAAGGIPAAPTSVANYVKLAPGTPTWSVPTGVTQLRIRATGVGGGGGGAGSLANTTVSTTLTNGIASGASLAVSALPQAIASGSTIVVNDGAGHTQAFTTTALAAAAAVTVAITSVTVTLNTGSGYAAYGAAWSQAGGSGGSGGTIIETEVTVAPANVLGIVYGTAGVGSSGGAAGGNPGSGGANGTSTTVTNNTTSTLLINAHAGEKGSVTPASSVAVVGGGKYGSNAGAFETVNAPTTGSGGQTAGTAPDPYMCVSGGAGGGSATVLLGGGGGGAVALGAAVGVLVQTGGASATTTGVNGVTATQPGCGGGGGGGGAVGGAGGSGGNGGPSLVEIWY